MSIAIEISSDTKYWNNYKEVNIAKIEEVACRVMSLNEDLKDIKNFSLSILLTNNEMMKSLNAKFRNILSPTDVLSFPSLDVMSLLKRISDAKLSVSTHEFIPISGKIYLGDIAFGYESILNYVDIVGIKFTDRFIHLLVHSILHLLNYTHDAEEDFKIMSNLESQILKFFSITPTYISLT